MCGIAGFLGESARQSEDLRDTVTKMTLRLAHRGPDDSGVWIDPSVPVALGHRRLSIIDLSPEGHQPMLSATGRYVLVFNGEIYNFLEIRGELTAFSEFRGGSDTEVMLAAFEQLGVPGALDRFNGMFAFGLWDRKLRQLHLACDRFGEKPLYYGRIGKRLVFGSELKALRAHAEFPAEIDRQALAHFLNHGFVAAPHSIFRSIRKLEPGTWLTVPSDWHAGELPEARTYWSARDRARLSSSRRTLASPEEAVEQLEELLMDSIRLRTMADVPVGAFLSGGIDSSVVVALMQKVSGRPVRTFTIGMEDFGFDEAIHARAVAKHLGTNHSEMYITSADAMAVIPRLPELYDEPFADSSQIPTFLVSQFARTQVTVSLSGDGGDELFGGYTRYLWGEAIWRRIGRLPQWGRAAASRGLRSLSPNAWDVLMNSAGRALPPRFRQSNAGDKMHKLAGILGSANAEKVYEHLISFWPSGNSPALDGGPMKLPASPFDPGGKRFTDWMMLLDTVMYLPGDILCKVDRAAMAVGLESRIPLLDSRLFEFAWGLPAEYKVRDGTGKWLLRQVLYRHVPRELMERPKTGFGIPIHAWLRGPLRDWAHSLLDPRQLRDDGLIDPVPVMRRWDEHLSGKRNWAPSLWAVLMFQSWLHHRDGSPAKATSTASTLTIAHENATTFP